MSWTAWRNTHQVFFRMPFNLSMVDALLMIILERWVLRPMTTGVKHGLITSHWGCCLLATRLISGDAKALISWLKQGLSGFSTRPSLPPLHTLTGNQSSGKVYRRWEDLGASPVWENNPHKFSGFFCTAVSLLSHLSAHSIICLQQYGIMDI